MPINIKVLEDLVESTASAAKEERADGETVAAIVITLQVWEDDHVTVEPFISLPVTAEREIEANDERQPEKSELQLLHGMIEACRVIFQEDEKSLAQWEEYLAEYLTWYLDQDNQNT